MAQVGLTILGSMVPGFGPLAAYVGGMLGRYIDQKWLFPSKSRRVGPSVDAIHVQTSTYGIGIPVLYGIMRMAGNVIWASKIREEVEHIEGHTSFFGQSEPDQDIVHLYASFAIGICEGPIAGVLEIYINGQRLTSFRSELGQPRRSWTDDAETIDKILTYRIYNGSEDQDPDPVISLTEGAENTPAFRGLAYVVFEDFPVDLMGGSIPTITFEVAQSVQAQVDYQEIDIGSYLSQIWRYDASSNVRSTVEITDIDGDGLNELVFLTYDNRVIVLANDGTLKYSYAVGAGQAYGNVCCIDVNGDGKKEIIWPSLDGKIRCMAYNLSSTIWSVDNWFTRHGVTPPFSVDRYYYYGPTAGIRDVSGVPTLCLFFGGRDGVLTCVRASDGAVLWEHNTNVGNPITENSDIYFSPVVRDIDLDGQPEVAFVDSLGECILLEHTGGTHQSVPPDVPSWAFGGEGTGTSDYAGTGVAVADVNGDGVDEIIFTGSHHDVLEDARAASIWILDGDGNQLGFLAYRIDSYPVGVPVVFDPEGTNRKSVFVCDASGYVTCLEISQADCSISVKWDARVSSQALACGACVLDVDGDGTKEVVVGVPEGYVVALDPQTGDEKQRIASYPPTTIVGTITGGDIDGDGYVELIVPLSDAHKVVCLRGGPSTPGNWFRRSGITSDRASEVTDYDPDGELHRDRDLTAQDNMVVGGPGDYYAFIETSGVWNVWDSWGGRKNRRVVLTYDSRANGIQTIPASLGSDFDIDEDSVIYTSKVTTEGIGCIAKLDGITLALIEDSHSWTLLSTPILVRVSKNGDAPWLVVIAGDGSYAYVMDRRTLKFGGQYFYRVDPANANYKFKSAFVDQFGIIWLISHRADNGWSKLKWLYVSSDFVVTAGEMDVSPTVMYASLLTHDPGTDQVMVGTTNAGGKISFYAITRRVHNIVYYVEPVGTLTGEVIGTYPKSAWQNGTRLSPNGRFYYTYGTDTIHGIDLLDRTIAETYTVTPSPGGWAGGCCILKRWLAIVAGVAGEGFSYALIQFNVWDSQLIPVSDIVWDICERSGMDHGSDFSVADMGDDRVWGYLLDNRIAAKEAIQPLAEIFFFDGVEENGILNFKSRGGDPIATIPREHLAAHATEEARPQEMEIDLIRGQSLASTVEVIYLDYDANYEQGTQIAFREGSPSTERLAVNAPVAIDGTTAKRIAYKTLGHIWTSKNQRRLTLPRDWIYLCPADVVDVETEDGLRTIRIDKGDVSGSLVQLDVSEENPEVYNSSVVAAKPVVQGVSMASPGPTYLHIVDCALLSGLDDRPGVYVAATGGSANWRGARLLVSRDGGSSWNSWGSISVRAAIGKAASRLSDHADAGIMDRSSTLTVRLIASDQLLETVTESELLAGANMAVCGDEVIQFQTATLMSDGSYLLQNFVRGRRGTEWAMGSHAVGEHFVPVSGLAFHEMSLEDRTSELRIKAVSFGTALIADAGKKITPAFKNIKPLAPCRVAGTRDETEDLTILWTRRTRLAGEWQDETDVPLAETSEAYEADILLNGSVVRTIQSATPSCTYAAAQQVADGITPGDPVPVVVYQMSTAVGRGFPAAATV